jgi:heptosyltransferase-2
MIIEEVRNILIIKWGALGDIIAGTPAIRAVREAYHNAHILLLSNRLMEQIVPAGTLVDELLVYEEYGLKGWNWLKQHGQLIQTLRKRKLDVAINLRWCSDRTALLAFLSGARYRVGSGPREMMFLYNVKIRHPVGRYHEIHRNLDIVKALGIGVRSEVPFVVRSLDDRGFADRFFEEHSLQKYTTVGIHPGSSRPVRAWIRDRFTEIGKRFINKYDARIVITWGPGEEALARQVAEPLKPHAILSPATKTIGQLASIIERCGMIISNCTGPMNVAMAVETPVVAILGSSHPADWGPYGEIHRTIKSSLYLDGYTDDEEHQAMKAISVDEVWTVAANRWDELHTEIKEVVRK